MAAEKASQKKIIDVSKPSETAADSTSRPVIVSNRPLITQDPMMAAVLSGKSEPTAPADAKDAKDKTTEDTEKPLTPHAEKIIKPLGTEKVEADAPKDKAEDTAEPSSDVDADAKEPAIDDAKEYDKEETEAPVEAEESKPDQKEEPAPHPAETEPTEVSEESDDKQTSPEAVKVSEEDLKRAAELEEIIASGKYNVPINARGKRRTLIITIWLVVLTLLLAAVLVDALLDVGILNIEGVPHTHFFSLT